MIPRRCTLWSEWHHPHAWERLNPKTNEPYRHGRVVFLCRGTSR